MAHAVATARRLLEDSLPAMGALPQRGFFFERQRGHELAKSVEHSGFFCRKRARLRVAAELREPAAYAFAQRTQPRTSWIQPIPILIVHSIPSAPLGRCDSWRSRALPSRDRTVAGVTSEDDYLEKRNVPLFWGQVKSPILPLTHRRKHEPSRGRAVTSQHRLISNDGAVQVAR